MSVHRPGQWPVENPITLAPAPAPSAPPMPRPEPEPLPAIDVLLTITVDLTGRYDNPHDVVEDCAQQTRRHPDCHTAIVKVGPDALTHGAGLGAEIAGAFYLSARRIEIQVPAGRRDGRLLHAEVARYVRLFRADHQQMQWQTTQATG